MLSSCIGPWGPIASCPWVLRGAQPHRPTAGRFGVRFQVRSVDASPAPLAGTTHAAAAEGTAGSPGAGGPAQAADILEGNSCSPLLPVAHSLRNGRPGSQAVPAAPAWSHGQAAPGPGHRRGAWGQSGARPWVSAAAGRGTPCRDCSSCALEKPGITPSPGALPVPPSLRGGSPQLGRPWGCGAPRVGAEPPVPPQLWGRTWCVAALAASSRQGHVRGLGGLSWGSPRQGSSGVGPSGCHRGSSRSPRVSWCGEGWEPLWAGGVGVCGGAGNQSPSVCQHRLFQGLAGGQILPRWEPAWGCPSWGMQDPLPLGLWGGGGPGPEPPGSAGCKACRVQPCSRERGRL